MGKNKKVFVEAVSEMKHFLLGAALVLTVVAVVPAMAQMAPGEPPMGGTPMQPPMQPPMQQPMQQPAQPPVVTGVPAGQLAPEANSQLFQNFNSAPQQGLYGSGNMPAGAPGANTTNPNPWGAPNMQNNMQMPQTVDGAKKMYEQQNPGKPYTSDMAKEFEAMKTKGPMMNAPMNGMNQSGMPNQMGGKMGQGMSPMGGMNNQGGMPNQIGGKMGQGMSPMGGMNNQGGMPNQMGSQMGDKGMSGQTNMGRAPMMGSPEMGGKMSAPMGDMAQGMMGPQGDMSKFSPMNRFDPATAPAFSFGPQQFNQRGGQEGEQGQGQGQEQFQGPTPEEQAAQEEEMRAKFEEKMNSQRLAEMQRGAKQALQPIAQAEKQLAKFATKGCEADAEALAAISQIKESLTAVAQATSADDVNFDVFQEMGDLRGTIDEAFQSVGACMNAKPVQKAAAKELKNLDKIVASLVKQAAKNPVVESLLEEANSIVAAAKEAFTAGDDALKQGQPEDATDSYGVVFDARDALNEVKLKADILKNLRKASAQFTAPLTEIKKQLAAAKQARLDTGTLADGVKQLTTCVASVKTVSTSADADADTVFAKVDECNALVSALRDGLDTVFGVEHEFSGITGLTEIKNLDLGSAINEFAK